jgi:tetratricopeptide (TPR) repeat protein
MRNARQGGWTITVLAALLLAAGCAPRSPGAQRAALSDATAALQARDHAAAIQIADQVLASSPDPATAARAYYLRGRAIEDLVVQSPEQAKQNLALARQSYVAGLNASPDRELGAYLHASLADVAYWQEDYATAVAEGSIAYPRLPAGESQAWTLYRVGVAQQRLGQFDAADRTFAEVQRRHAGTEPAVRARDRVGKRAFFVQLATFQNAAAAEKLAGEVASAGLPPHRLIDEQNRHIVGIGPLASYAIAQQARSRFTARFPDALIIP